MQVLRIKSKRPRLLKFWGGWWSLHEAPPLHTVLYVDWKQKSLLCVPLSATFVLNLLVDSTHRYCRPLRLAESIWFAERNIRLDRSSFGGAQKVWQRLRDLLAIVQTF